jgi:hypothetical protein
VLENQPFIVQLYNMEGKQVLIKENVWSKNSNKIQIPTSELIPGLYQIIISWSGKSYSYKILIQK